MRKLTYLFYIPVLLLAVACTKNIDQLDNNTKAATTVPAASLFLGGLKNLSDNVTSTSGSVAPFRNFAQTWTECTYITEARYQLTVYDSPDYWWSYLYGASSTSGVLSNFYNAKAAFPASAASPDILKNDLIITDIMEIYSYYLLVNTYGNIPYSQAENRAIPFPKYDDAKTVFYDLLTRLDTCIADINTSATAMGNSDVIYSGDPVQWKKFAATLKLKMAMLIADTDPATAGAKVQEAVTAGIFTSNSDNARFPYDGSSVTNSNPIWQAAINSGRHDNCPASTLVNQMVAWQDPRLPLYFTLAPDTTIYIGGTPGNGNSYPVLSTFADHVLSDTLPGDLLDYAETEFLLAEAVERGFNVSGSAEQHYDNAITASIVFWGGTTAQANTYLQQSTIAYSTAAGDYKQKIGYQKWIALWNRGWDAWTEIRRLGQPNINVINPPVGAISPLPLRFWYPLTEQSANPSNYAAAVGAMGADLVTTKLFWMP
jgi:hypothetical protein